MGILRTDNISGLGGREAIKGSVYFTGADGPPGWLDVEVTDTIGSGNFTAEWWFKPKVQTEPGTANRRMLIIGHNNVTGSISINWDAVNNDIQFNYDATGCISSSTIKVYADSWYHIAVVREGTGTNETKLYINGQLSDSGTLPNNINQTNIEIGRDTTLSDAFAYYGLISNLRITKKALYTAAFTPPLYNLKALDETILLCCQDNDDPTKEATGKEIVGVGTLYYGKRYSNVATNGDLETGDTTGWTSSSMSVTPAVSTFSHSGSYSLYCETNVNGSGVYQTVSVDTNHRYKISGYIYNVTTGSTLSKMKIGSSVGGNQNYESQKASPGKWTYHEWIGIPVASTLYVTFVESASGTPVVKWYVDDLRVEKWYPEEDQNILGNSDFLTDATGWSFSSTPSGEFTISSNRLNIADTSRTSNAYATQQLWATALAEGKYRITVDYVLSSGGFDIGVGNSNIWSLSGSGSVTAERVADGNNSSFRIIANQHCVGYFNNVSLFRVAEPKRLNEVPSYGVDQGVTFTDNTRFDTLSYMVPPKGTTEQRGRGRCIVSNGSPGTRALYYLQMQSGGIIQSFGNLANAAALSSGCGSSTRMLVADGYISPASTKIIEYLTIATTSNGTNFGELTVARRRPIGMSNTTRGVWATGSGASPTPYFNEIDYNTIASLGDALDFGDASGNASHGGGVSSSTRGIYSLGYEAPAVVNTLDYIIIATTGSRANFGDLNHVKSYHFRGCSSSDSTRGLFAGGYNPSNNNIDYITMASTGDATDFGDLSVARRSGMATGNSIDAIFVGGYLPGASNTIDKVTIQTTGNAVDFGDLTVKFHEGACSSDSHGGLS